MTPGSQLYRHRYHLLLGQVIALFFARPLLGGSWVGELMLDLLTSLTILSIVNVASERAVYAAWAACMAVPLAVITWVNDAASTGPLDLGETLLSAGLYGLSAFVILRHVVRAHTVSIDHLLSAVTVYFLLGFFWSELFRLAQVIAGPEGGLFSVPSPSYADLLYVSFVSLTSMDFATVVPHHPFIRSMALCETIAGQFFLAILVARLVALHLQHSMKTPRDGAGTADECPSADP